MNNQSSSTRDLHLKRKVMWDNSMKNHGAFLDKETGLFKESFVENRNCPTCESPNHVKLFYKSGGAYVRCSDCEMVFLNPVFKNEALETYYRNNHDSQSAVVAQDFGFYRELYTKGLSNFQSLFSSTTNPAILDIGCSAGGFLNIAKEAGWSTYGLEFNQQEAKVARQNQHEVFEMDLGNFVKTSDLKFNAVTLWDVFEHIKDGAELLENARTVLDSNGGVFIQSPTSTALAARMLQEKCNMFDGLEHVNLYTHENMQQLAKKTGFEVHSYCTVISERGVINNYLDYQDPYLGSSTATITNEFMSDDAILKNNLGYKFQIFLKKK
jgi:2-polyprenyl-3-methyl-5-hydroxy-6-metoxy-1,4-benzoquinol methylase